jgi:phage-related protein
MSIDARRETGALLRELQEGESLSMPHSRALPVIGPRCHELRVNDKSKTWRIIYRVDADAILVLDVFEKKTRETPPAVIEACRRRLRLYEGARP